MKSKIIILLGIILIAVGILVSTQTKSKAVLMESEPVECENGISYVYRNTDPTLVDGGVIVYYKNGKEIGSCDERGLSKNDNCQEIRMMAGTCGDEKSF